MKRWRGWMVTGQATPSSVEAKSVEFRGNCHGILKEMRAILTRTSKRRRAGKRGVEITAIAIMWTSTSEVIPGLARMPSFRRSAGWMTPPPESLRTRPSLITI